MARMKHCSACKRHCLAKDPRCPHCGAELTGARSWSGVARGLKVGSLMVFTALTTTACYGGPRMAEAPIDPTALSEDPGYEDPGLPPEEPGMLPRLDDPQVPAVPTPEPPEYKIPLKNGTVYLHWTPKDGETRSWTLNTAQMNKDGPLLILSTANQGAQFLRIELELPPEGLPESIGGVRQALPAEKIPSITGSFRDPSSQALVFGIASDVQAPEGTLQIDNITHWAGMPTISGVLLLDQPRGTLQLYFRTPYLTMDLPSPGTTTREADAPRPSATPQL